MSKKIKVVITGGAGFIGSHIAEEWINRGADVHVIDNLRSGCLENLSHLPQVVFHQGSITDRKLVFKVLKDADYIHHLAALVSVPESFIKMDECLAINVNGLINVLDAAKENNSKKVVLSSSAAVYGDNPVSPKTTDMTPQPKSPYGITKLDGEYYLKMYSETYGLGTVSLRYFNVFGQRQDPNSQYSAAIPIFVSKAIKNETITVYGDGEQTRDFIFIKDVVAANILAAEGKTRTGVFNVACGHAISINELIRLVLEETNSKSRIEYLPERAGDIKHSLASIEDTIRQLGFSPGFNLTEGLRLTIQYFYELYK